MKKSFLTGLLVCSLLVQWPVSSTVTTADRVGAAICISYCLFRIIQLTRHDIVGAIKKDILLFHGLQGA